MTNIDKYQAGQVNVIGANHFAATNQKVAKNFANTSVPKIKLGSANQPKDLKSLNPSVFTKVKGSTWGTTKRIVYDSAERNTKANSSDKKSTSASNSVSRNKRMKPPVLGQVQTQNQITHVSTMPMRDTQKQTVAIQQPDEVPVFLQQKAQSMPIGSKNTPQLLANPMMVRQLNKQPSRSPMSTSKNLPPQHLHAIMTDIRNQQMVQMPASDSCRRSVKALHSKSSFEKRQGARQTEMSIQRYPEDDSTNRIIQQFVTMDQQQEILALDKLPQLGNALPPGEEVDFIAHRGMKVKSKRPMLAPKKREASQTNQIKLPRNGSSKQQIGSDSQLGAAKLKKSRK